MTRIIVCGGREFSDQAAVDGALDAVHKLKKITVLVHGAARGADSLAVDWAKRNGIKEEPHPYPGDKGKAGGPIRNQKMADAGADGLVVFPGGRGTADMEMRAKLAGIPTWRPYK